MVSPLIHLCHDRQGKTGEIVAAMTENIFSSCRQERKMEKRRADCAARLFLRTGSVLKACSAGTESVSLKSGSLKLVRHTELYAGDAVLVGAIASHIAGHGFPFIICMGDHAIK